MDICLITNPSKSWLIAVMPSKTNYVMNLEYGTSKRSIPGYMKYYYLFILGQKARAREPLAQQGRESPPP
jgi:hypothetical protein